MHTLTTYTLTHTHTHTTNTKRPTVVIAGESVDTTIAKRPADGVLFLALNSRPELRCLVSALWRHCGLHSRTAQQDPGGENMRNQLEKKCTCWRQISGMCGCCRHRLWKTAAPLICKKQATCTAQNAFAVCEATCNRLLC